MGMLPLVGIDNCGNNPTMEEDLFKRQLKQLLADNKINMRELERTSGVSYDSIRGVLSRGNTRSVSVEKAHALAKALGYSVEEILTGKVPPKGKQANFPSVPRYDASLSAGHGRINFSDADILDRIPFTYDFLERRLARSNTSGLICLDAVGESMEPNISDGDLLVIDRDRSYEKPGVYAVVYNGDALVKRVERIGSGYNLLSDHASYPPISVNDQDEFEMIGKVVWVGRVVG